MTEVRGSNPRLNQLEFKKGSCACHVIFSLLFAVCCRHAQVSSQNALSMFQLIASSRSRVDECRDVTPKIGGSNPLVMT